MAHIRDRKTLLLVGASAVLVMLVFSATVSWGSPARVAALPLTERTTVHAPSDTPEALWPPGAFTPTMRRALAAPTTPADRVEGAAEGGAADLARRYERAIQEYVEALDASATREFEAGRFLWHEQGTPLPAVGSDEIISVRRAWEGRYRVARMDEAEYSKLHRLRSDVVALAELLEAN